MPDSLTPWARAYRRWSEMASALSRVPEPECNDPGCVELKGERLHFATLMQTAPSTLAELATKIELATERSEGWEPDMIFWRSILAEIADLDGRAKGEPLDMTAFHRPPNETEYLDRVTRAVLDAIIRASQVQGADGRKVAAVQAGPVVEVLLGTIAILLCQSRECSTPQGTRLVAERIVKKLRRKLTDARSRGLSLELHQLPTVQ